ncbi:THAP domain-containing protein 11-like [Glandiceps talaboti]
MPVKRGGYTCCVPGCYNNNKRERELKYYVFPKEPELRKKWLKNIGRVDDDGSEFQPTTGHRVCSVHFEGGLKTYMINVPTEFSSKNNGTRKSKRRVVKRSIENFSTAESGDDVNEAKRSLVENVSTHATTGDVTEGTIAPGRGPSTATGDVTEGTIAIDTISVGPCNVTDIRGSTTIHRRVESLQNFASTSSARPVNRVINHRDILAKGLKPSQNAEAIAGPSTLMQVVDDDHSYSLPTNNPVELLNIIRKKNSIITDMETKIKELENELVDVKYKLTKTELRLAFNI